MHTDIALERLVSCENLTAQIEAHYATRHVNKFEIVGPEEALFKMIRSNVSLAIKELDEARQTRKKFICLNDDMDPEHAETPLVRELLRDFYESLVPQPSQFELPQGRENVFRTLDEWRTLEAETKAYLEDGALLLLLTGLFLLFLFCLKARTFRKRPSLQSFLTEKLNRALRSVLFSSVLHFLFLRSLLLILLGSARLHLRRLTYRHAFTDRWFYGFECAGCERDAKTGKSRREAMDAGEPCKSCASQLQGSFACLGLGLGWARQSDGKTRHDCLASRKGIRRARRAL